MILILIIAANELNIFYFILFYLFKQFNYKFKFTILSFINLLFN